MRILIWQWGRRGAGPLYAAGLATHMRALPGITPILSLSAQAEILATADPPRCELPFATYESAKGLLRRAAAAPFLIAGLTRRLRALAPDIALCGMPAALDFVMMAALRRAGIPTLVVIHDADIHPGDGVPFQAALQRRQIRQAQGLVALTDHVAARLHEQGAVRGRPLLRGVLPPFIFGPPAPPPGAHGGPLRLLSFGRLLPYKGIDLLAEAIRLRPSRGDYVLRVVGSGPESEPLAQLRTMPDVTVENRWVPEAELADLLGWSDALVLSHREASQSGVAAAAIAAGRWVISTRVGGLVEQLADEPLARFCDTTPDAIAAAIEALIADPPPVAPRADPHEAWREAALALVTQIEHAGRLRNIRPPV
jgi:glycosyltransferase involved in cell wall biosynthesis